MSDNTDLTTELTKAQEKKLSEGVQLQFAAKALFETLTTLPVTPPIALGALAACAGEFLFRLHKDPRTRITNRMAFEKATRDTLKALEAVEKDGVAGATKGLAELEAEERYRTNNVVPLKPKEPS
jgi:hypothetical protein